MKIVKYIFLLLLWGLMIGGIYWARGKSRDVKCTGIKVEVVNEDNLPFVTPEAVKEELKRNHLSVLNKPLWQVDVDKVEMTLTRSPYIEHADCMLTPEGVLLVRVSQIVPVVRVFDGEDSYYLNKNGKRMEARHDYHANVPIIKGHFTKKFPATRLLPLVNFVNNDSAWSSLVTMYSVRDSNNIYLVPSIHGHIINFGSVSNIENKFAKLQLFYKKVMPQRGWMTFDTISVKWDHQVVATRRAKRVETVVEYTAEDDEAEADMETVTMGDVPAKAEPDKKKEETKKKEEPKKKAEPEKKKEEKKKPDKKKEEPAKKKK